MTIFYYAFYLDVNFEVICNYVWYTFGFVIRRIDAYYMTVNTNDSVFRDYESKFKEGRYMLCTKTHKTLNGVHITTEIASFLP